MLSALRGLRLFQTESNRGRRGAFRSVGYAATRAEYRNQHLAGLAARGAIALNGANIDGCRISLIALCAFLSLGALWTLRALCPGLTLSPGWTLRPGRTLSSGLSLRTWHALDALRPLRAGRSRCARLALGAGVSAAPGECQRHTDDKYRKNSHANPPVDIRPLMVVIFHHYAFNHARAPALFAGPKVAAAPKS